MEKVSQIIFQLRDTLGSLQQMVAQAINTGDFVSVQPCIDRWLERVLANYR